MEILQPVEVRTWGQVPYAYIEDAITEAERLWGMSGVFKAAEMIPQLMWMVQQRTWRSARAASLILDITRVMLYTALTPPPTQEEKHERLDERLFG